MRDAWPEVLARLEGISRSSWLIASAAEVVALKDDVLTLAFQSQATSTKFKQLVGRRRGRAKICARRSRPCSASA